MKKKATKKSKPGSRKAIPSGRAKVARKAKPAKPGKTGKPGKGPKGKAAKPVSGPVRRAGGKPVKSAGKAQAKSKPKSPVSKAALARKAPKAAKPLTKLRSKSKADEAIEVFVMPEVLPRIVPEPVPVEDEGTLRNVMASLTSIFGGRDFLSDAELDAFLDSKIASGEIPPSAALDPLDEAQSLIYEAWNSEGPQRIRLAHRALETSPDCADAYVILAEEDAKDRKHALELYRKGVEAGERSLDPDIFRKSAGKFWEIMETRPYMRARLGLAECLWEMGKKEEALGHLRELFRLNPADNQGVRYILAQCLLETGAEGELGELLERFRGDTSPQIRYSHALWMFRHDGPGRKASALLDEAVKNNPHVAQYLLKRKKLPKEPPQAAEAGSDEEAAAYAMGAVESWHKTLGAADWLAEISR